MNSNLIKTAADTIEAQANKIASLEAQVQAQSKENETLTQQVSQTKQASDKNTQTAQEAAAKVAPLAKLAADKLYDKGMFSTPERRDQFAANAMSHDKALDALAKIADYVETAPKIGTVVVNENHNDGETSDDVWARHVQNNLNHLPVAR